MNSIFKANWIKSKVNNIDAATEFVRSFKINGEVECATLFITAHGAFVPFLNGERLGDDILAPGWTVYDKRHQYLEYDFTDMLEEGENELCVGVGRGWFFHANKEWGAKDLKPDESALIAAIEIEYENGKVETIVTDESWQTRKSRVIYNHIWNGETLDLSARKSPLKPAVIANYPKKQLIPAEGEPIHEIEEIPAAKLIITPKGEKVIDFAQELTGYVEVTLDAPKGTKITLQHFEMLDKDGNVYIENLRSAKEQFTIISGGEAATVKPQFTFYGFRYVQVIGLDDFDLDDFTAIVVHSDMTRTGHFHCSNEMLNQFYHNVIWGQKGNFLDIPTDCPQRDERLGWTGDAEMFSRTAAINFDVSSFFDKWLGDVRADQHDDGSIPFTVPNPELIFARGGGSPAWDDAAVIVPWEMYVAYGDLMQLEKHFPLMKGYVDFMLDKCREKGIEEGKTLAHPWTTEGFGDWLSLEDLSREHGTGETDRGLIATAYLANDLKILIKASRLLDLDCDFYEFALRDTLAFFRSEYLENGKTKQDLQTAQVLALVFELTDNRDATCAQLVENVEREGRLTTGFIGSTYLLDALTMAGRDDLALTLLLKDTYPSWLYSITKGATTVWERWNGIFPDGHFATKYMNSFNHYAYGSVFAWMFRRLAGICPMENAPGYEKVRFVPYFDERIPEVSASIETMFGEISSSYEKTEDGWRFVFVVPEGVDAIAEVGDRAMFLHEGVNVIII